MSPTQIGGRIDGRRAWLEVYLKCPVFHMIILGSERGKQLGVFGNIYVLKFGHYEKALAYCTVLVEMEAN